MMTKMIEIKILKSLFKVHRDYGPLATSSQHETLTLY